MPPNGIPLAINDLPLTMDSKTDTTNPLFALASSYVNHTNRHVYLTGRAGTGKTTFLKHIIQHTSKKFVIVAPTGVAAINAGGVTAHSLFQLPMGAYIPGTMKGFGVANELITDRHTLLKNMRVNAEKRKLWQEMELLIIDEISMVRADMLDAIDQILRNFRKQPHKPFGGVQVLYIGDLYQLPPVVSNQEWAMLSEYYNSPFFFDAQVSRQEQPVVIELKKIYRQSEKNFIRILNNIRNNEADYDDLDALHQRYLPDFDPAAEEGYILLTSHNNKAESVNQKRLEALTSKPHYFEAQVDGDFSDKAYPADSILQLKVGAQVMFIKNDKGENRRYYNGKIGTIRSITDKGIAVGFPGEKEEIILEREVWKNIRYKYNEKRGDIDEEELGSFAQYPIRLAWAITIHKSQGLTFERAIVDAGASFAPGQVYVALSRLTSLEGLVLHSKIEPRSISTDPRVVEFTHNQMSEMRLENELEGEQREFLAEKLMQCFDWSKLMTELHNFHAEYMTRQIPERDKAVAWSQEFIKKIEELDHTSTKFRKQLLHLIPEAADDQYVFLNVRVEAAVSYFLKALRNEVFTSLQAHFSEFQTKVKTKKYVKDLGILDPLLRQKEQQLEQAVKVTKALASGGDMTETLATHLKKQEPAEPLLYFNTGGGFVSGGSKGVETDSKHISYDMFLGGKSVQEIATARAMVAGTIETHLLHFIKTGELAIEKFVPEKKLKEILATMREANSRETGLIKNMLGDQYSFNEIRAVQYHLLFKDGQRKVDA